MSDANEKQIEKFELFVFYLVKTIDSNIDAKKKAKEKFFDEF